MSALHLAMAAHLHLCISIEYGLITKSSFGGTAGSTSVNGLISVDTANVRPKIQSRSKLMEKFEQPN
ncbi:hypothetical protein GUJ93_ZPchr0002g24366 [Zizania palustris]|uniref:Uncharacterized protein n=1 Tax=Zizania palustris TaxID=103762 RepID=A0A8J5RMI1_ZIZPA|nr:hypothetical protein GUJ93_ZPchr0002g24366 [Zizania palustris]